MKHNTIKNTPSFKILLITIIAIFCFTGLNGCGEENPTTIISSENESHNTSSELNDVTSDTSETKAESITSPVESSPVEEANSSSEVSMVENSIVDNSFEEVEEKTSSSMNSLQTVLEDIDNHYHVATAGSSLMGAILAAEMLDWAMDAEITDEEILTVLKDWPLDKEAHTGEDCFTNRLRAVSYTICRMIESSDYTILMLESAGSPETMFPWNEKAFDLANKVLDLSGINEIKPIDIQDSESSLENNDLSSEEKPSEEIIEYTPSMNSLQTVIEGIRMIAPSTAGSSMHMAACTIRIMDWAMDAEITDDQIKTVWENWPIDKEYYVYEEVATFTHQLAIASSCIHNIEEYSSHISSLMRDSDIFENSKYPWNERAISLAQHVMDLSGINEVEAIDIQDSESSLENNNNLSSEENSDEGINEYTPSMNSLQTILEHIRGRVNFVSAGFSLMLAKQAAEVLDWAMEAEISDAEIMKVWENWPIDKEFYVYEEQPSFTNQLDAINSRISAAREDMELMKSLMRDAGVLNTSKYPWNDEAFDFALHVMDLTGINDAKRLPEDPNEISWIITYQPE